MKHFNLELSPEIKTVIENRRKKLLFAIYMISLLILSLLTIKNIYYDYSSIVGFIPLLLICISFVYFYRNKKYDNASYSILFILACVIIGILIVNKFDNYSPVFIILFSLSTFFLFSWKKGLFINILFFLTLISIFISEKTHFENSVFLNNFIAVSNFIVVLFVVFIFTYFYELTRVESYKLLLESNYKKDLLYRELQHRVKNNLNIVSSMLTMQAQKESKKVKEIIQVSKNRIDSMAMIHSMLNVSNNIEKVKVKAFLEKLSNNLKSNSNKDVDIKLNINEQELPLNEIIPIGLIVNELLTNSFKYAFKDTPDARIVIVFKNYKGKSILAYHDNGPGYNTEEVGNMGLKLVKLNVKQLKGTLKIKNNNGLGYKITYKRSLHV